jgi:hypothetical protein
VLLRSHSIKIVIVNLSAGLLLNMKYIYIYNNNKLLALKNKK